MAIRVVARIRPQQLKELEKDVIVSTASSSDDSLQPNEVKIPNPRNERENFTFVFNRVYDCSATQQQLFDNEVAPTIKHLFGGFDVTIFAYGSTGTGKTHTMRGGKTMTERGMIPRLLSGIYRRARKVVKESAEQASVEIFLSYYEIYNDKVFDLFEAPEKRSLTGLPIRDNGNKAVVVGLTERSCDSLKDFEKLYDQANLNRSTSATKLNAVSSRSHAILGIKLAVTTGDQLRTSTASAIDLAGSEDNRRTENQKERMVESANINKSLFTLAKCVEAISRQDMRIPNRESKMTRILNIGTCTLGNQKSRSTIALPIARGAKTFGSPSCCFNARRLPSRNLADVQRMIGQNNSLTVMILNLAPVRSYHQDTLSSLNFANRTKKIEVRAVENEPILKGCTRAVPTLTGATIQRQPLRPLATSVHNSAVHTLNPPKKQGDRQAKSFSVYLDKAQLPNTVRMETVRRSPLKRPSDPFTSSSRPRKRRSPDRMLFRPQPAISREVIEKIIEDKVTHIFNARALDQPSIAPQPRFNEDVQKRLKLLEKKIDGKDDGREQGLTFLLMAKQHSVRGEDPSALRMYTLAKDYFPDNKKLDLKIDKLRDRTNRRKLEGQQNEPRPANPESGTKNDGYLVYRDSSARETPPLGHSAWESNTRLKQRDEGHGGKPKAQRIAQISTLGTATDSPKVRQADSIHETEVCDEDNGYESDGGFHYKATAKQKEPRTKCMHDQEQTPRTRQLLKIVNARDVKQIKLLKGVGARKAGTIVEALRGADRNESSEVVVESLDELGRLRGVGPKTVESMRMGLGFVSALFE